MYSCASSEVANLHGGAKEMINDRENSHGVTNWLSGHSVSHPEVQIHRDSNPCLRDRANLILFPSKILRRPLISKDGSTVNLRGGSSYHIPVVDYPSLLASSALHWPPHNMPSRVPPRLSYKWSPSPLFYNITAQNLWCRKARDDHILLLLLSPYHCCRYEIHDGDVFEHDVPTPFRDSVKPAF